jgi:hypothetical protein
MSDVFDRLLEEAAGIQLSNLPPFVGRSPSESGALLFASAAPALLVGMGTGASALPPAYIRAFVEVVVFCCVCLWIRLVGRLYGCNEPDESAGLL